MPSCLVGLGANLGDREATLHDAVRAVDQLAGVRVTAHSRLVETQPVGGPANQGIYLNAALTLETDAAAPALLDQLLEVERNLGRARRVRWGPRSIDIDLLLHGQTTLETAALNVPHPWLAVRRFVLEPAVEIAPQLRHPQNGWTIQQLWEHLLQGSAYLAVTGCDQQLVTQSVRDAAAHFDGHTVWDPTRTPRVGATPIESETTLLHERARQLDSVSRQPQTRPFISDFWLTDALATTTLLETSTGVRKLTQHVKDVQSQQVLPWLVVLLEQVVPDETSAASSGRAKYRAGRRLDPMRLRELVMHAAPGPWLKLQVTTAGQATELLIAAIASRGPRLPHPRRNA